MRSYSHHRSCATRREQGSGRLVRFPARRSSCVWLFPEDGAWTVLVGSHGWLHGDICAAFKDAQWLSQNFGLPVRCVS
jgi:hypothetical protein